MGEDGDHGEEMVTMERRMVTMERRMVTMWGDVNKSIQEYREQPHTLVFFIDLAVAVGFMPFLSQVCLLVKK